MTSVVASKPGRVEFLSAEQLSKLHQPAGGIGMCPYHNALKAGDTQGLRDVAAQMLRDHTFGDDTFAKAEKVLVGALQMDADPQGKTNHLLGQTYFLLQKWGDAVKHLEVAQKRDPGNADIAALLKKAKTNAGTGVEKAFGTTTNFDRDELLKPPAMHLREPEGLSAPTPGKGDGWFTRALRWISGETGGAVAEAGIWAAGKARDKTTTFQYESWDNQNDLVGKLMLADIRHDLNKDKLQNTYDDGVLVGFQQPGQKRPAWTERFRTATGAWTTNNPMEGAAGTEFQRTGAPVRTRTNRALDPDLPSAREISRALFANKGSRIEAPFLNAHAISWIQFQNHDWVNHRPSVVDGAYKLPLAPDDPFRAKYGIENLYIPATSDNPLKQAGKITYLNEVTGWWDGSQIYGSDQETQDRLRQGADGKMLAKGKLRIEGDLLPLNPTTGVEDTGFARNWWVNLDLFHTLFVKNHNVICEKLAAAHPDWSSDELFNRARLVNSAIMAKIHTVEWTPAVLPNKKLAEGMAANWWGLLEQMTKTFEDRRTSRKYEPRHEVLGGIVGGKTDNHGKPYNLSEEFVEVYRLHAGMLDRLMIQQMNERAPSKSIDAEATRGSAARDVMKDVGAPTLWNSGGNQHMPALVHNNYPDFMTDMSVDGNSVVDLGAIDIMRARERGVPPYNEFRKMIGLNPLTDFRQLGCKEETVKELERLYGKGQAGIDKMDLLVGTLCELNRPKNYGFGETLFQVFIQMASRRLQADPFYTEKFTPEYYSEEGYEMVQTATLKSVLLENYPELKNSGLMGVDNAFEPWGTTAATHPEEHPLHFAEKYRSNK